MLKRLLIVGLLVPGLGLYARNPRPSRLATAAQVKATFAHPLVTTAPTTPRIAENGDLYGIDNNGDGRIENIYVPGRNTHAGYIPSHYISSKTKPSKR